jgi:hemolysin activation/secretion protein
MIVSALASNKSPDTEESVSRYDVMEYRIKGAKNLPKAELESAVYPFLGPMRTDSDVEKARAALEKLYRDKGFQAVTVQIPQQKTNTGIIELQVLEGEVGRLRVYGARYFSPSEIKRQATSLAEGKVLDFKDVSKDIVSLNQWRDRRITPSIRAGEEPGKVDVDLTVKDTYPLHGTLELNNRYSPGTPSLRANASVSYSNLWQMGHTLGVSFQTAPENFEKVKVLSAFYLAPVPDVSWLSLMLQGTKQDSDTFIDVGSNSIGKGEIIGASAIFTLPQGKDFYHSITLSVDYKHFESAFQFGTSKVSSPITYFPLSASYSASWSGKDWSTEFNASTTYHARGVGSSATEFDSRRYKSDGSFIAFRSDVSHTRQFIFGTQLYGKIQAQGADQPLIDSEQFSGGGLNTARGYFESEKTGDNALFGTAEWRTPSLTPWIDPVVSEWRFYIFGDAGMLSNYDSIGATSSYNLGSVGTGSRVKISDHFNGSLDMGIPLIRSDDTDKKRTVKPLEPRFTFRLWSEF